ILAVMSSRPPAKLSFKRPQSPLGSAAEMAIPAIVMLSKRSFHSSEVKFDLSAMSDILLYWDYSSTGTLRLRSRCSVSVSNGLDEEIRGLTREPSGARLQMRPRNCPGNEKDLARRA